MESRRILTQEQLEEAAYQAEKAGVVVEGGIGERSDELTRMVEGGEVILPEDN